MLQCQDSFFTTFNSFNEMMDYHVEQSRNSVWKQVPIHTLHVKPIGLGDASFLHPMLLLKQLKIQKNILD